VNQRRNDEGRSYADSMFEGGDPFTGHRVGGSPPQGLVITEGPFAQWDPNRDPVAQRREKLAEAGVSLPPQRPAAAAISVQTGDSRPLPARRPPPTQPAIALVSPVDDATVNVKMPKVASPTQGLEGTDFGDGPQSTKIDAFSLGGGTPPVQGSDIGQLPPAPDGKPNAVKSAPGNGSRGPSSAAAARVKARVDGKVGKEPVNKTAPVQPQSPQPRPGVDMGGSYLSDDKNRAAFVSSGVAGAPSLFMGDGQRMKVGSVTDSIALATRDDVHPLALYAALTTSFGGDWMGWEPETIQTMFEKNMSAEPTAAVMNKAMALKAIMNRPETFFSDWHGFEKICIVFSGDTPHMTLIEEISPEQMAHACVCARHLVGKDHEFGDEMKQYIAARLLDSGLVVAPLELGFVNRLVGAGVDIHNQDLRKRTTAVLAKVIKEGAFDPGEDEALGVQLTRLLRVHAYVLDRFDELAAQLG
jgi:hypothetical protein